MSLVKVHPGSGIRSHARYTVALNAIISLIPTCAQVSCCKTFKRVERKCFGYVSLSLRVQWCVGESLGVRVCVF